MKNTFDALDSKEFETLCRDLLEAKYGDNAQEYLASPGFKQDGIDSYVYDREGNAIFLQAKHEKKFGQTALKDAIREFEAGKFFNDAQKFIIAHTSQLTSNKLKNLSDEIRSQTAQLKRKKKELIVWNAEDIERLINIYKSVVLRYPKLKVNLTGDELHPNSLYEFKRVALSQQPQIRSFNNSDYLQRIVTEDESGKVQAEERYTVFGGGFPESLNYLHTIKRLATKNDTIRHTLVSFAGWGKSYELKHIAYELLHDNSCKLIPLYAELSGFHHDTFEAFLDERFKELWRVIPRDNLYLILDAFDEIPDGSKDGFDKKLANFTKNNPVANILVSSRKNVYEYPFEGFATMYIQGLSHHTIFNYLKSKLSTIEEANDLLNKVHERGIYELLRCPFDLVNVVAIYIKVGSLPESSYQLIKELVKLKVEKDVLKKRYSKENLKNRKVITIQKMNELGLVCLLTNKNELTEEELQTAFVSNPDLLDVVKPSFLLATPSKGSWKFEHNNYKEYFAVNALSKLKWTELRNTLFNEDNEKIYPQYFNVLTLLFSSLLKEHTETFQSLLSHLTQHQPDLLVRLEHSSLQPSIRNKIAKQLFENAREKNIVLRSRFFDYHNLITFIEFDKEFIEYLLSLIEQRPNSLVGEAIFYLSKAGTKCGLDDIIKGTLIDVIKEKEVPSEWHRLAIQCLSALKFCSHDVIDVVISNCSSLTTDFSMREDVIQMICEAQLCENYIDFILQSITCASTKEGEIRRFGDGYQLWQAISSIKDGNLLEKVLDALTKALTVGRDETTDLRYYLSGESVEFESFLENLKEAQKNKFELAYKVANLLVSAGESFEYGIIRKVKPFFTITNTSWLFFLLYQRQERQKDRNRNWDSCLFVDKSCIAHIMCLYEADNIDLDDILTLYWSMNVFQLSHEREELINALKDGFNYKPDDINDQQGQLTEIDTRNYSLLFNQELFLNEIRQIQAKLGGNDGITTKELMDLGRENYNSWHNTLIYQTLLRFSRKTELVKCSIIVERLSDPDKWEDFVVNQIRKRLDEDKAVDERGREVVNSWVKKMLPMADFSRAVKNEENGYSRNNLCFFIQYFFVRLGIEMPKEKVKEMTWLLGFTDNHNKGGDSLDKSIINVIGLDEFKVCLQTNLSKGIECRYTLSNQLTYANEYKVEGVLNLLENALRGEMLDDYEKGNMLRMYMNSGGNLLNLESIVHDLKYDNFSCRLISELMKVNSSVAKEKVRLSITDSLVPVEGQIEFALMALEAGMVEGLNYWVSYVKENYPFTAYDYNEAPQWGNKFSHEQLQPILIFLLSLSFERGIQEDIFEDRTHLYSLLKSLLFQSCLESKSSFTSGIALLEELISKKSTTHPRIHQLNYWLNDLRAEFETRALKTLSFEAALKKVQVLSLQH